MADQLSCDVCPKTFASRGSLFNHKQIHSGVKKYCCPECNKSFGRSDNLKSHSLIHTGEKPHKCTHCDYSCSVTSSLKTRMKKHSEEKIYNCNQCEYKTAHSCMRENTQGKNCTSAFYVNPNWQNQETCKRTRRHTLVKTQRDAQYANIRVSGKLI